MEGWTDIVTGGWIDKQDRDGRAPPSEITVFLPPSLDSVPACNTLTLYWKCCLARANTSFTNTHTHTCIYNDIYRHRGIVVVGVGCGFANH